MAETHGSQISNIRSIKNGLREASRFFVELCKAGAPLKYIDVGGGMGVDCDGSQTNFSSSVNYTLQEYANDVVFAILLAVRIRGRAAPDDHQRVGLASIPPSEGFGYVW